MKKYNENVLSVSRSQITPFQGVIAGQFPQFFMEHIFDPRTGCARFVDRNVAENCYTLKQLIPYIIITNRDTVLTYSRGTNGGEQRLKDKRSIGLGGHINDTDNLVRQLPLSPEFGINASIESYTRGLIRELKEEVPSIGIYAAGLLLDQLMPCALVNDDSDEVGIVHLGLVHVFNVSDEVAKKVVESPEINDPQFTSFAHLYADTFESKSQKSYDLENWSRWCVLHLREKFFPF